MTQDIEFQLLREFDYFFSNDIILSDATQTLRVLEISKSYHKALKIQLKLIEDYERNDLLEEGYAFSDYAVYFLGSEELKELKNPKDDFLDHLISRDYFESLYEIISTFDDSKYIEDIFSEIKSAKDARKLTPYLIIFIEKKLRKLTNNITSKHVRLHELREKIEEYISKQRYEYKSYIKTELLIEPTLFYEIQQKYQCAYFKNLKVLIQEDFYQNENKQPREVLINRHTFLHGKFNFDKISNKNVLQLSFLISFLYQLEEQTKPVKSKIFN